MGWQDAPAIDDDAAKPAWASAPAIAPSEPPPVPEPEAVTTLGGLGKNIAAGLGETATGTLGAIQDMFNPLPAASNLANSIGRLAGHKGDVVPRIPPSSEYYNKALGLAGANPEDVQATTTLERIARGAGQGIGAAALPGPGKAKALDALIGALSGAGGAGAQEVVPDAYKPLAGAVGALATGAATHGTVGAAKATAGAAGRAIDPLLAAVSETSARRQAGQTIADRATDIDAARSALDAGHVQIVPGSQPTTFQQTGDMGLGSLENEVQTKNPALFQQRRAEQNSARLKAIAAVQDTGNPVALSDYIKGHIQWLDSEAENDISNATKLAQQRSQALGGEQTPEAYGAALREPMADARAAIKQRENALWDAIDPNGDMTIQATSLRQAARDLTAKMTPSSQPLSADEAGILKTISAYPDVVPFREIGDLRKYIGALSRKELSTSGRTPVWGRLTQMQKAVDGVINGAVDQRVAAAPAQVADGLASLEQNLTRQRADWQASRRNDAASIGATQPIGTSGISPVQGTASAVPRGLRSAPGDQRVSATGPAFDADAAARLRAASATTKERAQTYDEGYMGPILKAGKTTDVYQLPDAAVAAKLFQSGSHGFGTVEAYRKAVGDGEAMQVLQDYAASSLRKAAGRADGTLDQGKMDTWLDKHSDAMRAFPELGEKFRDAGAASAAMDEAAATQRAVSDAANEGALGKVAKLDNPEAITNAVGGIFRSPDPIKGMADLAKVAARNPEAKEGLRKAVVDYIGQKLVGNTEAATTEERQIKSDQFQTFIRQHKNTLRQVFSEDEVNSLGAIAADLQRSNRSLTAVKIPGRSNTPAETYALRKEPSMLGRILSRGTGMSLGWASGLPMGDIAGMVGGDAVAAMRAKGITRTNDFVREAMLNPSFAKELLAKIPAKPSAGFKKSFGARMRASLVAAGQLAQQ